MQKRGRSGNVPRPVNKGYLKWRKRGEGDWEMKMRRTRTTRMRKEGKEPERENGRSH